MRTVKRKSPKKVQQKNTHFGGFQSSNRHRKQQFVHTNQDKRRSTSNQITKNKIYTLQKNLQKSQIIKNNASDSRINTIAQNKSFKLNSSLEDLVKENKFLRQHIKVLHDYNLKIQQKNKVLQQKLKQIDQIFKGREEDVLRKNINLDFIETLPNVQITTFRKSDQLKFVDDQKNRFYVCKSCIETTENQQEKNQLKRKLNISKKIIQALQQQNMLLIDYKSQCQVKITSLKEQLQNLRKMYQKEVQQHLVETHKLQQQCKVYIQDNKNIFQLQELLKQANDQIHYIVRQTKIRDQEIEHSHQKFHRQMSKMKEKVQKYKRLSNNYRQQRDKIAVEMQKAKLQIGAFTLRKYLPESSDE